jgi:hypothetical protein
MMIAYGGTLPLAAIYYETFKLLHVGFLAFFLSLLHCLIYTALFYSIAHSLTAGIFLTQALARAASIFASLVVVILLIYISSWPIYGISHGVPALVNLSGLLNRYLERL